MTVHVWIPNSHRAIVDGLATRLAIAPCRIAKLIDECGNHQGVTTDGWCSPMPVRSTREANPQRPLPTRYEIKHHYRNMTTHSGSRKFTRPPHQPCDPPSNECRWLLRGRRYEWHLALDAPAERLGHVLEGGPDRQIVDRWAAPAGRTLQQVSVESPHVEGI